MERVAISHPGDCRSRLPCSVALDMDIRSNRNYLILYRLFCPVWRLWETLEVCEALYKSLAHLEQHCHPVYLHKTFQKLCAMKEDGQLTHDAFFLRVCLLALCSVHSSFTEDCPERSVLVQYIHKTFLISWLFTPLWATELFSLFHSLTNDDDTVILFI